MARDRLAARLEAIWYAGGVPPWWLRLLSVVYALISPLSAALGKAFSSHPGVPVVVVGNLTVGGSGKTPLVVRLLTVLNEGGFRPGVVSRGYRSGAGRGPVFVNQSSNAAQIGDEPLLIHRRSGAPVAVGSRRARAARALCRRHGVDVIVSDDGLQHYRLERDVEIAVIDGQRGFGNGRLLPAGPLREPLERLKRVDYVVSNGGSAKTGWCSMELEMGRPINLVSGRRGDLETWRGRRVIAMAGIGHPERFFSQLESRGLQLTRRPFPDHHHYVADDLSGCNGLPLLTTEKDAVKLRSLAGANCWYVPVSARLPASFERSLLARMRELRGGGRDVQ